MTVRFGNAEVCERMTGQLYATAMHGHSEKIPERSTPIWTLPQTRTGYQAVEPSGSPVRAGLTALTSTEGIAPSPTDSKEGKSDHSHPSYVTGDTVRPQPPFCFCAKGQ